MPCVSDTGATAPISALTYAFSIGLDRGHTSDDFEAEIIETAAPGLLTFAQKATRRCRDMPPMRRPGDGQPTHAGRSARQRGSRAGEPTGRQRDLTPKPTKSRRGADDLEKKVIASRWPARA